VITAGRVTAGGPHPGAGSSLRGAQALIREARQRQRRRWRRRGLLGVSLMLLAAAAVTGAVGLSGRAARVPVRAAAPAPPGPAAAMPSRVVVWTAGFKIEVLSSRTGRLIRTLATNVALFHGLPTLAVSATGVVYFDDVRGDGNEWVFAVPLAGGPVTAVAEGFGPAISPDGRLLAYVTFTDRTGRPQAIVVRDLAAGTQKTWAFSSTLSDIYSLSWSPGGRFLAFTGITGVKNGWVTVPIAEILDTRSAGPLDGARPIPLAPGVDWAGFLTPGTGVGVMAGPGGLAGAGGSLVEVGAGSGRVLRHLTALPPHALATANGPGGAGGTITANRSGRYLLIAGTGPDGYGVIFRWTFGMPHPVSVTSGAFEAAWAG
jgi:hypothetical protein